MVLQGFELNPGAIPQAYGGEVPPLARHIVASFGQMSLKEVMQIGAHDLVDL